MNNKHTTLLSYVSQRDLNKIQLLYSDLLIEKMKMDKFFSMFLNKFEKKMDCDKPNTPIWALYKKKANEYSELERTITLAKYYLNNLHV